MSQPSGLEIGVMGYRFRVRVRDRDEGLGLGVEGWG